MLTGFSLRQIIITHLKFMTVYEAQRYKSEGRAVRFPMGSLGFFVGLSFRLQYGPGVDSVCNRREYHRYLLRGEGNGAPCVRSHNLATFMCGMSNFREPHPPGTLRVYPGLYRDLFIFYGGMYDSHGHFLLPIFPVGALQLLPSTVATGLQPTSPSFVPPSTDPPFHMQ